MGIYYLVIGVHVIIIYLSIIELSVQLILYLIASQIMLVLVKK